MSIFVTTGRVVRNTIQHMVRNPWHSVTAVLVMVLTVFITAMLGILLYSSDRILTHLENKLEVTAFFAEGTKEEYILNLKDQLEREAQAEQVRYISQQQALEIYRQQNSDDPELLEFVTADILPASLSVSADSLETLERLAIQLDEDDNVERVIYQKDVAERFRLWSDRIRTVGIIFSGYLAAMSVLILLIVLSLSIREFGKEIEVMRLVGASSGYIRWPFILDGVVYGIISAVISSGLVYYLLPYAREFSNELVGGLALFGDSFLITAYVFSGSLLVGIFLGITGSMLAIWRHLRV